MKLRILVSMLIIFFCASLVEAQKEAPAHRLWFQNSSGTIKHVSDYADGNHSPLPTYAVPVKYVRASKSATVSTEVDTILAPTGTAKYWSIKIAAGDSIEWATNGSFTNSVYVLSSATDTWDNLDVASFPAVYVKRYGVGTVPYSYKATGF